MTEYIVTSTQFTGFLKFAYNDEGILQAFENNATLKELQLKYIQDNFPFVKNGLTKMNGPGAKITEHIDITFDTFWKKYNYKKGKIKAQEQWNKLTDEAKHRAIAYIPKFIYDTKLAGHDMLYPERYLSYRRFDDE